MTKIAVIDLGSNSVRMSIFDPAISKRAVKTYRSTIRLSEGMTSSGLLEPKPQLRAAGALLEYKKIMDAERIDTVYAVATAAVRKAGNRAEFLELIKSVTGIRIQVIDGETEAALDSLAVRRTLDCTEGIICDIGGGSTELIGICGEKPRVASIPYGSRGICEKFFGHGETYDAVRAAKSFVSKQLSELGWLKDFKDLPLVAIGGTLRAFAKYDMNDKGPSLVENHEISPNRMRKIIDEIEKADIPLRAKMCGIGAERADIILGGAILSEAVLNCVNPQKIVVLDVGVREGVFFDLIEGHGILKTNE